MRQISVNLASASCFFFCRSCARFSKTNCSSFLCGRPSVVRFCDGDFFLLEGLSDFLPSEDLRAFFLVGPSSFCAVSSSSLTCSCDISSSILFSDMRCFPVFTFEQFCPFFQFFSLFFRIFFCKSSFVFFNSIFFLFFLFFSIHLVLFGKCLDHWTHHKCEV